MENRDHRILAEIKMIVENQLKSPKTPSKMKMKRKGTPQIFVQQTPANYK